MSASGNQSIDPPEASTETCDAIAKQIKDLVDRLANLATPLDPFGPKESHAEGSTARIAADLRDHADMRLSQAFRFFHTLIRIRAETSYSLDLMVETFMIENGDGSSCLDLIEKYYKRTGDPTEGEGTVTPCTFPDEFYWETARRVAAIPALAERYPEHLRFGATRLQGLPMMVSHHIDVMPEFDRLAKLLCMGDEHPLDVSPRRKRGGITPAMSYLEPLIWRMDSVREVLMEKGDAAKKEYSSMVITYVWASDYTEKPSEPQIEVLRKLAILPRLTKSSALLWSREVVVPYILVSDGADPASSEKPFIRNIWNHRAVKSIPTFRSRLERAVTDFLTRYSRESYPDDDS